MFYVPVILGSTRRGRQSPKVARFLVEKLKQTGAVEVELVDLAELNLPIMEERLRMRDDAPPAVVELGRKLGRADCILIVSPEYNNGYPGVLKNAIDYFGPEYRRKPIAIATVSGGGLGGVQCLAQLRLVTLGMGAFPIPARFQVSNVKDSFSDDGTPTEPRYEKMATEFIGELLWFTEAIATQRAKAKTP